jgi:hypothetical protein
MGALAGHSGHSQLARLRIATSTSKIRRLADRTTGGFIDSQDNHAEQCSKPCIHSQRHRNSGVFVELFVVFGAYRRHPIPFTETL